MSGVVHSVTKVFSKVWDFVRPIVEIVAVCAAIYFTAGLALSAFPATAGFAAAMPGFAANGVAGAGIFSQAASAIGLGGGLQAGAIGSSLAATSAAAGGAAGLTEISASELAPAAVAAAGDTTAVASNVAAASALGTSQAAGAGAIAPNLAGGAGGAAATSGVAKAGMSITDKLLLASVGTNALSGFMAPTPADIQKAKNGWYGAFYGVDANGKGAAAPDLYAGPQTEPGRTYGSGSAMDSLIPPANTAAAAPKLQTPNMGSGVNMAASMPNMGSGPPSLMPPVQTPKVGA